MEQTVLYLSLLVVSCSVSAAKYPVPTESLPEKAGFNVERFNQVDRWISQRVDVGYPSVNLLIIKDNQIVYCKAQGAVRKHDGNMSMEQSVKATTGTLYDLASNTKTYATNFALQKLMSEDKLHPDNRIAKCIPGFADSPNDTIKDKNTLRIFDLLHHSGGFPVGLQYPDKMVTGTLYPQDKDQTLEMIKCTSLEYRLGSKHVCSDIDYMLLGFITESVIDQPLNRYIEESICRPLGLIHTVFNPLLKSFKLQQIVATELNGNARDGVIHFPNIRTSVLWGQMHGRKAFYPMGGAPGHVGLLSNTGDIAVSIQTMLNGGGYGDMQLFSVETVKILTTNSREGATSGLGWCVNGNTTMALTFDALASPQTYSHTGWTGAATVIDPASHMTIVMLNNRPHSSVADSRKNPNMFESSQLSIVTCGRVVDQAYAALEQK